MNLETETGVDEYNRPTLDSRGHPGPPSPQVLSPYPILGKPRPTDLLLALIHLELLLMAVDLDSMMVESHFPTKTFERPVSSSCSLSQSLSFAKGRSYLIYPSDTRKLSFFHVYLLRHSNVVALLEAKRNSRN